MRDKGWRAFFEDDATLHAQFQILTLFVFVSALILIIASRRYWHQGRYSDPRMLLPVIHVLPWYTALLERRRLSKLTSRKEHGPELNGAFEQTILRLLWAGYMVLALVEYSFY